MYTLNEHKFIFAALAASRGAATSKLQRFSVEQGQKILRSIKDFNLPNTQEEFDRFHRENRKIIISEAIDLIKKYSMTEAIKFVYGILGRIVERRQELSGKAT